MPNKHPNVIYLNVRRAISTQPTTNSRQGLSRLSEDDALSKPVEEMTREEIALAIFKLRQMKAEEDRLPEVRLAQLEDLREIMQRLGMWPTIGQPPKARHHMALNKPIDEMTPEEIEAAILRLQDLMEYKKNRAEAERPTPGS